MTIPEQRPDTSAYGPGQHWPVNTGWTPQGQWVGQGQWPAPSGWPPQPEPPRRRTGRTAALVGGGLAVLLVTAGGGFAAGWSMKPAPAAQSSATSPYLPFDPGAGSGSQFGGADPGSGSGTGTGTGSGGTTASGGATQDQVAAVAAKVDPALVDIDTVLGAQNAAAAGTGIVIAADGIVLTNNHVVAGATSITVTDIGNHKAYRAAVIGYDRSHDIAVLRLSGASGLTTATLATATVKEGDPVVAIGNAGGTGGTPSAVGGAVAALDQSITASDESTGASEKLTGLIEVNADIEAGDSGGPLLTTSGEVIGVDTAASTGFQYQAAGGDGYAIPISAAMKIADAIRGGTASSSVHLGSTAYLGIETTSSERGSQGVTGPVVLGVVSGSPAASAGLARGDVITAVAGTPVASATDLTNLLDHYHPGDKVRIAWTDVSGRSLSATAKLATGPVG
ncbi:S1C family serine protease [Actinoplanes sp. L3-i22]|uniref:S1C family serine protease n=1 Tax=Actinoplanes sp. L3-i22 TaxID=2836373 RepID=UPI001C775EDF|nr:trypsin-like peptidase domain-containing protein [Actinoplanes sp. L3-i22]BCY10691.1 hypothetical protein L3i22_057790 [Actinoplanes sp. L3-i22]